MRKIAIVGFLASLMAAPGAAQEAPELPEPRKEHQLLQKFAGEWVTEANMSMPGQPAVVSKGSEVSRAVGPFWLVSEYTGDFAGTPFTGVMTVGYDAEKGKYVGTWVCSMCDLLWKYEGTIDESGKVLTLNTEGPGPDGNIIRMKDVVELKEDGTKTLTSYAQGENGEWQTFMTLTATRKK